MPTVKTTHRKISSSQDCSLCHQIMRNFEKSRQLTPNQAAHYKLNAELIDERARTELVGHQLQLARQGTLDEVR